MNDEYPVLGNPTKLKLMDDRTLLDLGAYKLLPSSEQTLEQRAFKHEDVVREIRRRCLD